MSNLLPHVSLFLHFALQILQVWNLEFWTASNSPYVRRFD